MVAVLQVVALDFNFFDTHGSGDKVSIYDGMNTTAPLLSSLYGSYAIPPGGYISTQRFMFVTFVSDASGNGQGFSATYRSPPDSGKQHASNCNLNYSQVVRRKRGLGS